jgi:hypothetical protein
MSLRSQDRLKLQDAGFKIFRREESTLRIKVCNDRCEWSVFKTCTTKKELEQNGSLLKMELYIEDVKELKKMKRIQFNLKKNKSDLKEMV